MKKIHSILLGMGLITGGLMLAGWTSGETVTLEEIDTATQTEQLLKNHSSFQITSVYVDDDFTYSQYVDKDLLLVSYPDSTELYLDGQLNYLSEEDSLSGILYILQDPVAYPATDNVIFSSSADETITSCEEKDGKIYVSSDLSPEDTALQRSIVAKTGFTVELSKEPFMGGIKATIPAKNILIDNSFMSAYEKLKKEFKFDGGLSHE